MLALDDVSIALGGARILDRVSLQVDRGEWLTVIGPNGAGKSTLLRVVAGLATPTGRVELDEEDASHLRRRELAQRVALVPQIPQIPAEMSVAEYVLLGRTPYTGYFGRESRADLDATDEALERLDLVHLAGRRLETLSGGERQRVVLARALAQDAPLLLLDEPTSALDVGRAQQALELVDELRREQGLTVLAAMHDLTLAGQYADRLVLLDGGRIVARGQPAQVLVPELIEAHYGARVRLVDGLIVVPARPLAAPTLDSRHDIDREEL
jgi:iron complex transport system ATP-binding protein